MANTEGSFIRWQTITLTQLGYAVNLILSFATASLGFSLALAKDEGYRPNSSAKCLWLVAVLLLMTSIAFGIWCVLNRLADFRKTTQNAKDRDALDRDDLRNELPKEQKERMRTRLEIRRMETDELGKRSRALFYLQTGTFGLGVIFLIGGFPPCQYR